MPRDREESLCRVNERLRSSGWMRPVALEEGQRFRGWELASLVEVALGEVLDPDSLTPDEHLRWEERLGGGTCLAGDGGEFTTRYWLTTEQGIAGTVGVGRYLIGMGSVPVSSLYVHPGLRRAGIARKALESVYSAAHAEGLAGIRLDTDWTWQPPLRYYLARGMWVSSWKHNLGFTWQRWLPRHEFHENGEELALLIEHGGAMVPLLSAGRDGQRLRLRETDLHRQMRADDARGLVLVYGRATLALRLAVEGWPLIRSASAWDEAPYHSDIGEPEGLAYKIRIFEHVARKDGRRVDTPVIPGLAEAGEPAEL